MTYCLFGNKVRLSRIPGLGDGEDTRSTPVLVVFRRDIEFCFLGGNKVEFCAISFFDIVFFLHHVFMKIPIISSSASHAVLVSRVH